VDNSPIFEKVSISKGYISSNIPEALRREKPCRLPEASEAQVARHYTKLSTLNFGVDSGMYPLGSCTMKYNYKILERLASLPEFLNLHPLQDEEDTQGILEIMYKLDQLLSELFGYSHFTLQPSAGAQGEHTGLLIIREYLKSIGDERDLVLIPDSAHGTNPASAIMAGFRIKKISSDKWGNVDVDKLKKVLEKEKVAAIMLTNPSTLGLFENNILKIAEMIHENGGLLYYDGANANALLGMARPGDMGFDVCHLNLHKTFGTPHGGGGPGAGPVGVSARLVPFLPKPMVEKEGDDYFLDTSNEKSIGMMHGFYGNVNVLVKAYIYILLHGRDGLELVCEKAVANANYLMEKLKDVINVPYDRVCMHEFVISAGKLKKETGVSALDIAKALIDRGYHPPTIYFPLIVSECLMIEPTETEDKESMDKFIDALTSIVKEASSNSEAIKATPVTTIVGRLDEVKAVKEPKLTFFS